MSAAGVIRLNLSSINPNSTNFFIVGVIIAKGRPGKFVSKRDGVERGVWSFTLRDSPTDYINVVAWGTPSYIEYLCSSFRTGDVVDLANVKVTTRNPNEDMRFKPSVTSCLELTMNENVSIMTLHDSDDCINYIRLLHMPTRPPGNFLTLAEVKNNGNALNNQNVNLLVAVQKIGVSRNINTNYGKNIMTLEFFVMDKTSTGFKIKIWNDNDMTERAQVWKPRDTILFIADLLIKWDGFKRCLNGEIRQKTIVTENPNTKEAMFLAQFAATAPLQPSAIVDTMAELMPLPESIVNVMTCSSVLNEARFKNDSESFTALVYAVVESFDIDGPQPIISTKCTLCKKMVGSLCENPTCIVKTDQKIQDITVNYDMRISIMDMTSILHSCRLTGNVAANVLGCISEDFHLLSSAQKVGLKWKYLFNFVAARILVMPSNDYPLISVVSLNLISLNEFAQKLPIK